MAIEKKQIPAAPMRGLYLDGVTIPGGLSKAENITILPDGTAERRPYERTLTNAIATQAGRGLKCCYELLKGSGTRYIFADVDASETVTASFGAEKVGTISGWTPTSGWTWDAVNSQWDHSSGTTALVATMATAIEAAAEYHVAVDITCPTIYGTSSNWTYAHADSGYTWKSEMGNDKIVWLNTWTHASGSTIALNASKDFTPEIGASYVIKLHVTHTSGTGLTVYCGGITAGTIASSGYHTLIARFCTDTTGLRFAPSSNWVGVINKTWPRVPNKLDNWCSVVKLIDPAGPNTPSNYDFTASTHTPKASYYYGAELLYHEPTRWYAEAGPSVSQSLVVAVGGTASSEIITESGIYSLDITAGDTTALTFTSTTSWTGSINSASVMEMNQSASTNVTKVIGGEVSGTDEYEVTWGDIVTDLDSGDTVIPQWTTLQDRAFRVDGSNPNYWFGDAGSYHTLGCPAPADAPVTADASGGELLTGSYNVYYTYVKKYDDGYIVEGNPSPASNVDVTNNAISVDVIACDDPDVSNIYVYRTLYGEPGSFAYYCGEWDNSTATISLTGDDDTIRDTISTLEFDHDMPPLAKYALGAGSRLWLIDNDGTLHWSKLDNPEIMPSIQYQTFDPKDGMEIMGMCAQKSHILVFKRNKTWSVDMFSALVDEESGTASLARNVVSTKVGCIAPGSIQTVGNESAIWLSEAGFIYYNGGNIRNISSGGMDSEGNPTPSRIHGVIDAFIEGGAANFISSTYHTSKHLYHVNFITRNEAGDEIEEQRHFVYNLDSDTWTEYAFYNNDHEKQYEIVFILAHDSVGREILLTPYLSAAGGTSTGIYQINYETGLVADIDNAEYGSAEGGALCYLFVDAEDSIYGINEDCEIDKTTSGAAASEILTLVGVEALYAAQYGGDASEWADLTLSHAIFDEDNERFYIKTYCTTTPTEGAENYYSMVIRVTLAGVATVLKKFDVVTTSTLTNVPQPADMALNADGDILCVCDRGTLYKIASPATTATVTTYYTFTGHETTLSAYGMEFYGDNLYIHYIQDDALWDGYATADIPDGAETHRLGKFTDITGTADFESWELATARAYVAGMLVVSDNEIYLTSYIDAETDHYHTATSEGEGLIYKLVPDGETWAATNVSSWPVSVPVKAPQRILRNSAGDYYFAVLPQDNSEGPHYDDPSTLAFFIYNSSWEYLGRVETDDEQGPGFGPIMLGKSSASEESAIYWSYYGLGI